jgi:hypothetical protein
VYYFGGAPSPRGGGEKQPSYLGTYIVRLPISYVNFENIYYTELFIHGASKPQTSYIRHCGVTSAREHEMPNANDHRQAHLCESRPTGAHRAIFTQCEGSPVPRVETRLLIGSAIFWFSFLFIFFAATFFSRRLTRLHIIE